MPCYTIGAFALFAIFATRNTTSCTAHLKKPAKNSTATLANAVGNERAPQRALALSRVVALQYWQNRLFPYLYHGICIDKDHGLLSSSKCVNRLTHFFVKSSISFNNEQTAKYCGVATMLTRSHPI